VHYNPVKHYFESRRVVLMNFRLVGVFAMAGSLMACSTPSMEQIAKDQAKAEARRAEARDAQAERQQAKNEAILDQVPKWALQAPTPDATGIFAVGVGKSSDLRTAMRKAALDAEFGLAKNYNQEISGSERSFNQEAGSSINSQYTELIDKLVTQVPVVGLETAKQEVKSIGGEFHSFVLMKLPYAEFNKVLAQQRSKAQDATVEAAFVALEKRVKARQQERVQELAAANPTN
jgi:hypothetical protein